MNMPRRKRTVAILGGISLAAGLSGCATASGAAEAEPTTGPYTDGDYNATGEYQSPGGGESIEVDVTLVDDTVTAVTVTGNATAGNPLRFQTEFEEGIAAEAVGVKIDDLTVDKVAGSSLTSDGFNDAIEKIKADAAD